ncbi:DUF6247 family protein [Nocardiopsis sp. NPDC049922]|uniref:DUF6247 family protein n=1 Tax=Nocardiopsis sp. NPDC049922 TaxID=3155157 RepID=UPI0033EE1930
MSADARHVHEGAIEEQQERIGRSPKEIRAALFPEEAGYFDRDFRRFVDEAGDGLDLSELNKCLEHGWRGALSSHDLEAHRHMLDVADRFQRGEKVRKVPWPETKARSGFLSCIRRLLSRTA